MRGRRALTDGLWEACVMAEHNGLVLLLNVMAESVVAESVVAESMVAEERGG